VQYLRKKSHHRILYWFAKLNPLFDAYLGPCKYRHSYWVGALLLVRAILLIVSAVNPNNTPKVNLLAIGGTTLGLLAYTGTLGKAYRKNYLSFLENSFLLNLGALVLGTSCTGVSGQGQTAVDHFYQYWHSDHMCAAPGGKTFALLQLLSLGEGGQALNYPS